MLSLFHPILSLSLSLKTSSFLVVLGGYAPPLAEISQNKAA
jgi:hypothetical protein